MSELKVSTDEVRRASQSVRAAADNLDDRVRSLTERVEGLLNGGWKGQAADAFRKDWEQWLHGAKDVVGGLDSTSSLLASSASRYADQESSNASSIGASGSALLNLDF
ncbi:WXG100 family type VII secretion target [Williamsia sp. M5A3_1d]